MLELKDILNLVWKYLFLVVFTYGVISVTCCMQNCSTGCAPSGCDKGSAPVSKCCKSNAQIDKKCGSNCIKPCCKK